MSPGMNAGSSKTPEQGFLTTSAAGQSRIAYSSVYAGKRFNSQHALSARHRVHAEGRARAQSSSRNYIALLPNPRAEFNRIDVNEHLRRRILRPAAGVTGDHVAKRSFSSQRALAGTNGSSCFSDLGIASGTVLRIRRFCSATRCRAESVDVDAAPDNLQALFALSAARSQCHSEATNQIGIRRRNKWCSRAAAHAEHAVFFVPYPRTTVTSDVARTSPC